MSDIPLPPSPAELEEHRRSFFAFERLVLFAALHIALTLSCAALGFIGGVHVLAMLFWLGGTLALVTGFALSGGAPR
ncbi:MAG: hypothetical protein JSR47_14855 [Proteobacteria bacterium]|nr:hypothetical protein [Pseudomonadota bacterium]